MTTMNEGVYAGNSFSTELNSAITSVASSLASTTYNSASNMLNILTPCNPSAYIKIVTDAEIPVINRFMVNNLISWSGGQYNGGEPG